MSQHLKWVTLDLLKNIFSHKQSRNKDIEMNFVLLTVSTRYKRTVHNTNIYKLEIIAKVAISALTYTVKIVPAV